MPILAEYVKQEQNEMFPKAKVTDMDMKDLGKRILARTKELMEEMEEFE